MHVTTPLVTTPLVVDDLVVELTNGPHTAQPIQHLSFAVAPGTLTALLGPSGCGKTTLLSCLAGLLPPTSGSVLIAGKDLATMNRRRLTEHRRHRVGVVFQAFNLVASLDALENVMVPLRVAGVSTSIARGLAIRALLRVGMSGHRHHRPGQLSGGQQQRVAIARAIVSDAPLLLADEPTAHLDRPNVDAVLRLLRSLADEGRTLVVATHDERVLAFADQVLDLQHANASRSPAVAPVAS
jgi:putative ABC transport system ATP-binding protein